MHLQAPTTHPPISTFPTTIPAGVSISAAVEGGLSLSAAAVMYYPPRYWPGSTHQLICQALLPWPFVPVCLLNLCFCSHVLLHSAEAMMKGVQLEPQRKKKKCLTLPRPGGMQPYSLFWNAANISWSKWLQAQNFKYKFEKAIRKHPQSREDAGLNLKIPPSEMNSTTWARVKLSLSVSLSGKIQCQARVLL